MTTQEAINSSINGVVEYLPDTILQNLSDAIDDVTKQIDSVRMKTSQGSIFKRGEKSTSPDSDVYVNLQKMLNTNESVSGEFSNILSQLYAKNRQYYSTLKDYEIMPILIPQINRVLMFLVNETISPDIQNSRTFELKYIGAGDKSPQIQQEIDDIRKEMQLDKRLVSIITNRYKLGRDYYLVTDYNETFDTMTELVKEKMLNEGISIHGCMHAFDAIEESMVGVIHEASATVPITTYRKDSERVSMETISCKDLNIVVERTPVVSMLENARQSLLNSKYKDYSVAAYLKRISRSRSLNESNDLFMDNGLKQLQDIINAMKKKKVKRCTIERLDPARVFPLKVRGNLIGYFYLTDLALADNNNSQYISGFGQALKDRLMKSRATTDPQTVVTEDNVGKIIANSLAEKIINTFDPNIGIDRVEDIDLLHSFILDNKIYNGNKKIIFYYKDDIFDMSRAEESLLTNAVFFTKLYTMLIMNNIITKVLRGRGRQIHTVRLGASPATRRFIENAIVTLNNPEANLGMIHGSFEQLVNPQYSSSDIIIPTDEGTDPFISTDYIEGQNVDMDTDFLKFLLSAIVTSFGLDSAVIDATNGNIQFAKTLATENLQIGNIVKNEQNELHDSFEAFCLKILSIMGGEEVRAAVEGNQIVMEFYSPKTLMMQTSLDEISNAKNFAEGIADVIPEFNIDDADNIKRDVFIYMVIKERVNLDWAKIEKMLSEAEIIAQDEKIKGNIASKLREYMENTETRRYDEPSPEEKAAQEDLYGDPDDIDADSEGFDDSIIGDEENTEVPEEELTTEETPEEEPEEEQTEEPAEEPENNEEETEE